MRLIDTSTLTLHEFFREAIPLYAILSHRWEDGKVTFQDFRDKRGPELGEWKKITGCCAKAAADGWDYVVGYYELSFLDIRQKNKVLVPLVD